MLANLLEGNGLDVTSDPPLPNQVTADDFTCVLSVPWTPNAAGRVHAAIESLLTMLPNETFEVSTVIPDA